MKSFRQFISERHNGDRVVVGIIESSLLLGIDIAKALNVAENRLNSDVGLPVFSLSPYELSESSFDQLTDDNSIYKRINSVLSLAEQKGRRDETELALMEALGDAWNKVRGYVGKGLNKLGNFISPNASSQQADPLDDLEVIPNNNQMGKSRTVQPGGVRSRDEMVGKSADAYQKMLMQAGQQITGAIEVMQKDLRPIYGQIQNDPRFRQLMQLQQELMQQVKSQSDPAVVKGIAQKFRTMLNLANQLKGGTAMPQRGQQGVPPGPSLQDRLAAFKQRKASPPSPAAGTYDIPGGFNPAAV